MQLETLVDKLAKELELEGSLASEIPGVFALPLDEDLTITISPLEQNGITLYCNFAPLPQSGNEELFLQLLIGNLFGQGTKGASIGLSEEKKQLTLQQDLLYDVDYDIFRDAVEDFINTVDFWRAESHNYSKGT